MARLPRIVIPGHPLHVIQRGNNRQASFYVEEDYQKYLETLNEATRASNSLIQRTRGQAKKGSDSNLMASNKQEGKDAKTATLSFAGSAATCNATRRSRGQNT